MHKPHITTLPGISVVVIGLNVEKYLARALTAIRNSHYPQDQLEIIYVDSGSTDLSLPIAAGFPEVQLIALHDPAPNAAKGRNAGFQAAKHDLIHFVDADSYLDPRWLKLAVRELKDTVGAVAGHLNERFPQRNFFHRMAHLEWNLRVGNKGWTTEATEALTFGGNVLMSRQAYLSAGGYDETMVAGEDPDLSYRVRHSAHRILRLNAPMASHDINLNSWSQYLNRTRRSGVAYATLATKYWTEPEKFMLTRVFRILGGVLAPQGLLLLGALSGYPIVGLSLALLVAFRLLFKVNLFARLFKISRSRAVQYALYLAFSIYPQFLGVISSLGKMIKQQIKQRMNFPQKLDMFTNLTPLYDERQN